MVEMGDIEDDRDDMDQAVGSEVLGNVGNGNMEAYTLVAEEVRGVHNDCMHGEAYHKAGAGAVEHQQQEVMVQLAVEQWEQCLPESSVSETR